jgi:hypothetical protein
VGFVYASRAKAQEEFGHFDYPIVRTMLERGGLRERTFSTADEYGEAVLRSEVALMDLYVTGQVYGFEIIDDDGEVADSCWGFYSTDSGRDWETNGMMAEHWPNDWRSYPIYIEGILEAEPTRHCS